MLRSISLKTLDELLHTRFPKFVYINLLMQPHTHKYTTRYKSELYQGLYAL